MNQHDSAAYYLKKGNEYFELGKFQDAIKCFDNVIECFDNFIESNNVIGTDLTNLNNTYAEACTTKGECLNYLGKYQDAIKCADDAIKIKGEYALALSIKAESLNYLGMAKEALYFVNKALNSPHTDCDDEYDECHTLFVKCYSLQYIGKYRAALRQIKRAIDICEDNKVKVREEDSAVDLWITKGIILNQLGCFDEANKSFDNAIEKSIKKKYRVQDIAYAFINKSVSHLGLKNKDEALNCCKEAIKYSLESILNNPKDIHAWMIKGAALFQLEFYERAIECYDKIIIDIDYKFDFAWNLKGYTLNYLERYDEGLKCFEQAIAINKERAITINKERAITINEEGDITFNEEGDIIINKEGDIIINKEGDITFNEDIVYDIDYYIGEGISLYYLGRYNDAINCFNKAALDKDSAYNDIISFSRGASYYANQSYLKALDDFKKIEDVNLKGQKYTNIGACYHKLGLYEKAREYYNEAIETDNEAIETDNEDRKIRPKLFDASYMVEASYNLGVLDYNEGKVDTAKKLFETCLTTDSNFTKAKEALEKLNSNLTDTSEWFKWWFTRGIGKKVFGITLILSILFLIGIIIVMTTITLFFYYQNMALDNQTSTSEMLAIYKDVTFQAITATTIPIGLLILIYCFRV